jgi:transcriptional regulator with XRE-family HTH domain
MGGIASRMSSISCIWVLRQRFESLRIASGQLSSEHDAVAASTVLTRTSFLSAEQRARLRVRVGRLVRKRRLELGLKLKDISVPLGYRSLNAVSNVESGIEGIPAKRAYAWADVLELPRDAFFQFVTGQIDEIGDAVTASASERLTQSERDLLACYRRLPRRSQRLLHQRAVELETLAAGSVHRAR